MNILIYANIGGQEFGGIRQYTSALLRMMKDDTKNNYFVFHNSNDAEILKIINDSVHFKLVMNKDLISNSRKYKNKILNVVNRVIKIAKTKFKFRVDTNLDFFCRNNNINIVHCPWQYIPNCSFPKLITTMHDVQELHYPEFFTPQERASRANSYLDFVTRSNKIIVSYNHIKIDIVKYFNIEPQKVEVMFLPMQKLWFNQLENKIEDLPDHLNKFDRFLLYPANTWQHKNHIGLIRAIELLYKEKGEKVNLICTGHLTKHFENVIQPYLNSSLIKDQVYFAGIVSEGDLLSLYLNAGGVVVPTLYEAGSFPLMEAMLINRPVICSNVCSLPETIGDENFLFDPKDVNSMSNKIIEMWSSEAFREDSLKNNIINGEKIKMNNSLSLLNEIYSSLALLN